MKIDYEEAKVLIAIAIVALVMLPLFRRETCLFCEGTGIVDGQPCNQCDGTGSI